MGTGSSQSNRAYLPFLDSLHVVLLGLDFSGKTTILYRLKLDEFINAVPTIGFNTEKLKARTGQSKGVRFKFWDAGGSEKLRPLWKSYTRGTDAIIYVVDSSDFERFEEAKSELMKLWRSPKNSGVPILVIANKQDLREAVNLEEIQRHLGLSELRQHNPYQLIPACGITGEGLDNIFDILCEMINKRRSLAKHQKKRGR
ncbi:ADP-ribosylation factor-like protein 4C [Acanthaster planci]|uniref:ADP-ribosylation factor-like protein 11 n=1 Tax=Acanthaster planci TaxID=133434 RepID=A0A8B7ZUE0_ACAPL|nr:ADP-ribosylation factor-like protein 4C [Acanthaster planci]